MPSKDLVLVLEFDDKGSAKVKKVISVTRDELRKLEKQSDSTGKSTREMGDYVEKTTSRFEKLAKKLTTVGDGMKRVGKTLSMRVTLPIMALGTAVVKMGADFEQSMMNAASISGATGEELKMMTEVARDMGEKTVFSAKQAADAFYYMASAGWGANKMAKAIEPTLNLAAATQGDLAFTTETVIAALNQFQLTENEVGRVTNVFASAIGGSQATLEKLGTSMTYVGPIAHSMGMEIEEVSALLMSLYNAGYQASTAGTSLRMGFAKLMKGTGETEKALKGLGLSLEQIDPQTHKLADTIRLLGERGATTKDLIEIFGIRAGPAFAALIAQGSDSIKQFEARLRSAGNAAGEMAERQINTVSGSFKLLTSALTETALSFNEILGPAVKKVLDNTLIPLIKQLNATSKETKLMISVIAGLVAGVGPLLTVFGTLLTFIPKAIFGFKLLGVAIKSCLGPVGLIVASLGFLIERGIVARKTFLNLTDAIEEYEAVTSEKVGWLKKTWTSLNATINEMTTGYHDAKVVAAAYRRETIQVRKEQAALGKKVIEQVTSTELYTQTIGKAKDVLNIFRGVLGMQTLEEKKAKEVALEMVAQYQRRIEETTDLIEKQELMEATINKISSALETNNLLTDEQRAILTNYMEGLKATIGAEKETEKVVEGHGQKIKELTEKYMQMLPSSQNVTMSLQAMQSALSEIEAKGGDTSVAMSMMEDGIRSLYEEAQKAEQLFDTPIPEALLLKMELPGATEQGKLLANTVALMGGSFVGAQSAAEFFGISLRSNANQALSEAKLNFDALRQSGEFAKLTIEEQSAVVKKMAEMYKAAGKEVPSSLQSIIDKLKQTDNTVVNFISKNEKNFATLATGIIGLGESIGGTWGGILSELGGTVSQFVSNLSNNLEGGIGAALGSISGMLGSLGGMIGSAISGASKEGRETFAKMGASLGQSIGGMFGPIGSAVGSIAGGLLGGLFKKPKTEAEKFADSVEGVTKSLERYGEVSEATAKVIAEDMKDGMSQAAAEAKHFDEILEDIEITESNLDSLWSDATNTLDAIASGELSAAEGAETLGNSFSTLLENAQEFGTEGSAAMVDFINQVKASGLEVAEVTDYINDQLGVIDSGTMNAAQGLEAMAEGVGNNQEALARLETQSLAVFNAMIENGATYAQAMESIGGTLDAIIAKHEEMGTEAGADIQELMKIREVTESHKGLFNAIEGNLAVMDALANTGSLTQETFMNSQKEAVNYFNQLKNAGLSQNQSLAQMAPTLERIAYLAREHGLAVDETTQKLINQAEEQGLIDTKVMSMQDTMMAGFGEIIKALGGDVPAAFQEAMDAMNEMTNASVQNATTMTSYYNQSAVDISSKFGEVAGEMSSEFARLRDDTKIKSEEMTNHWEERIRSVGETQREITGKMIENVQSLSEKTGKQFEKMDKSAREKFMSMTDAAKGSMELMAKTFGTGAEAMSKALGGIQFPTPPGGGKGTPAIAAQGGLDMIVDRPVQPILAHQGEHVKITPKSEVTKEKQGTRNIYISMNIYAQKLDDRTIYEAKEKLYRAIKMEERRT